MYLNGENQLRVLKGDGILFFQAGDNHNKIYGITLCHHIAVHVLNVQNNSDSHIQGRPTT